MVCYSYSESIEILYSGNVFAVTHMYTLACIQRKLLPECFQRIRHLRVHKLLRVLFGTEFDPNDRIHLDTKETWNAGIRAIKGISGLQTLEVDLYGHWSLAPGTVLQPLCDIRHVAHYVVRVTWREAEMTVNDLLKEPYMVDSPFRLVGFEYNFPDGTLLVR